MPPRVLFTGFEPSGDDHASAVIRRLIADHPEVEVFAWGGPKMEAAGASIVERTGERAVMGIPGIGKIIEHLRINRRVARWLDDHPVDLHVPVDSPAANFPLCELAQKRGIPVMHLVAPQVWAWASWRVKKLRRLSDLVLCLLPFEPDWFAERDVRARFVGHPLFDEPLDYDAIDREVSAFPEGSPRIALMPGSRPVEYFNNFPLLLEAFRRLAADHQGTVGVVAATTEAVGRELRDIAEAGRGWPKGLHVVHGQTDAVARWCTLSLVVSGTVTLQLARQHRPMVIVYKSNPVTWHLIGRWIVATKLFTLPNLIAGREIVPELVPHFGDAEPIVEAASALLDDPEVAAEQRRQLAAIEEQFRGHHAARGAAHAIAELLGLREPSPRDDRP